MIGIEDLKIISLVPIMSVIATFHPMSDAKIAGENTEKSICWEMDTSKKLYIICSECGLRFVSDIHVCVCLFVLPMFNILLFRIDTQKKTYF